MVFQISIGMSVYECGILEAFVWPLWMSFLGFVSDEARGGGQVGGLEPLKMNIYRIHIPPLPLGTEILFAHD